ncbi:DUF742 domain-containing protein [Kribbella antibiotica]|uniref:DUF742 domain-containing protein n=1 Tax=Kribbella antibiotica TaxID=190195 RepID=A0A4V2YQC1_9ACTN|nr:DUF742 domain-containing protein [Kribbella antibiotica]TDD61457.1 DUF742 domain-containing protein [Kribbella antibiotica]
MTAIRFGGWADYREWAERDFRDRAPAEESGDVRQVAIVVEALTDLVPIKVLLEETSAGARNGCRMPSNGLAPTDGPDPAADLADSSIIRPYVRSGGRSEVKYNLEFETLVEAARPYASLPIKDLTEDQRHICRVCVMPQSVAEVAVAISAPLGLARTIISEAIDRQYLRVHQPVAIVDGLPPAELLRRVYSGLARLSATR